MVAGPAGWWPLGEEGVDVRRQEVPWGVFFVASPETEWGYRAGWRLGSRERVLRWEASGHMGTGTEPRVQEGGRADS